MTGVPFLVVTTGLGWGGTIAWVVAIAGVVLLGLAAWWVARPARRLERPPRRTYRVPPQRGDRGDNGAR